ncbi:GAS2-like protein pickled eggs [Anthonomus grandis grandis]|uniref:GAS2-like protein pickled eggs n=1 Tax=Anthonomus grandis grandis TaxID=2921223 RepID=UPI0021660A7A|nr:GAS2-like protein pickled eggs [Anthonomus grandis grandis]XP_050310524.1 GAS2-like protein pickled eggs [Anthonomus grandis grandis]
MSSVLLEARPFRPFKSSEEYLYAMKEDLAEWLQTMYPHLNIAVDNFMEKLETGVALCEHANAVKAQAVEYVEKKQARQDKKAMTRSVTGALAQAQSLIRISDVKYFSTAKPGTFFARDNVSNFINWCRFCLEIIECLLFESDDLIMRKNEKHVVLCLLEVARRGARFGMLAPMLVQMERQIDREIAADQKKLGFNDGNDNNNELDEDSDSEFEEEAPMMYGPVPQIVTNDLKSLDEMVRDLVAECTCPTQFPMIRVSEGKYRIGDTKVLIFVRILRKHVMVRVGGGWDTLAHYLDKHDPCRCRAQHRPTQSARLVPGRAPDLHGSHVYYDRTAVSPASLPPTINGVANNTHSLGPPMNSLNRSRSRSPSHLSYIDPRRSVSPNFPRKSLVPPSQHNRSRSPTPNFTSTHHAKISTNKSPQHVKNSGPQSLPFFPTSPKSKHVASLNIPVETTKVLKSEAILQVNSESHSSDNHSDTSSQMSDEGYRSLGIHDKNKKRSSVYSQNSADDVEENDHQNIYTEDELNDFGLRKTNFSQRIYENDPKLRRTPEPTRSVPQSPTTETDATESILLQKQKPSQNIVHHPSSVKSIPKLEDRPALSRTSSSDKVMSPKKTISSTATSKKGLPDSKTATWSGRQRPARPSVNADTFVSPFQRNVNGRRSVSAVGERRTSLSANSSPTKSRLKQELLNAVKKADDDEVMTLQIKEVLRKYGSVSVLDNEDDYTTPTSRQSSPFTRQNTERMSSRSPRKDSRQDNNLSRIPAPIVHRA